MIATMGMDITTEEGAAHARHLLRQVGAEVRMDAPADNGCHSFEYRLPVDTDGDLLDLLRMCLFYLDRSPGEIESAVRSFGKTLARSRR